MREGGSAGRWTLALLLATTLTVLAAWRVADLDFKTSLVDLLPDGQPAAEDYRVFLDEFGGFEKLFVVLTAGSEAPADDDLADAADLLAVELRRSPWISGARSGLEEADETFLFEQLLPRLPLLVDPDDPRIAERLDQGSIRTRVDLMRQKLNGPLAVFESATFAADPLGLADLLEFPLSGYGVKIDPVSGAFLSPARDMALVVATPSLPEFDSDAGHALIETLDDAYASVREQIEGAVEFHALGGPLYAAHDEKIIRGDVVRTVTGSVIAISLLLVLYFRAIALPGALSVAVAAGIVWTGGVVDLVRGEISFIGIAFASILLGLGVDYGIHGATRYREARLAGDEPGMAMLAAFRVTGRAIVVSVLTTVAAFAVLSMSDLGSLRELGQTVAFGIVAILVSSVALGAALVVLWDRAVAGDTRKPTAGFLWKALARVVDGLVGFAIKRPRVVILTAIVLTALATMGIGRVAFDPDLRSLRPDDHPLQQAESLLTEGFGLELDTFTAVVRGDTLDQALADATRVASELASSLGEQANVISPSDWLVTGAPLRRRVAAWEGERTRQAVETLERELRSHGFDMERFARSLGVLRAVGSGDTPPAIPGEMWPDWLAEQIRVGPQSTHVAVRVRSQVEHPSDTTAAATVAAATVDRLDVDAAVASVPRLAAELRQLVGFELRNLGAWSVLAVGGIVLISFRGNPQRFILSMLPVALGAYWLLGIGGGLGLTLNLFTLAVAPLLLGIGIDDGLHTLHGVRPGRGLAAAAGDAGKAMTLTSLTTCVGFGSLAFSRIPALRQGGILIAIGIFVCLLTTLMVLPALDKEFRIGEQEDEAS